MTSANANPSIRGESHDRSGREVQRLGRAGADGALFPRRRVNMLCPGPVETEFNRDYREQGAQEAWERATPLRNPGESIIPDATRIAPAAVFLVSDEARHVTGASLLVDGGTNSM